MTNVSEFLQNFSLEEFRKGIYLFNKGEYFDTHKTFGSHPELNNGVEGFRFTVWAPQAKEIYLVSDFTDWTKGFPLVNFEGTGVWTGFFENAQISHYYKYRVVQADGTEKFKTDPHAFEYEVRPKDASVVKVLRDKDWSDGQWFARRKHSKIYEKPLNIYEVHLSSWKHHDDDSWYTITELKEEMIPYVQEMGYTHIEFMPLMEHPLDASWGYQITGFFALSSKFGTIEEFQDFVEECHKQNIGVLVDWVPGHFNRNDYAMAYFDGTAQYEYTDVNRADNNRWGTLNFDLGKAQVHSFLISNAMYWIETFHLDGLRIDAVSNMLYLDYDEGPWTPNEYGTNINYQGVEFVQKLNKKVFERHPETLMIAEESTSWEGVTKPVHLGGLGFNYKWNMGWMNDTLKFFEMDPEFRKNHFNLITFSFLYTFNENYILPFSHDEVVHGKKSMMHKMFGDRYNQFAGLRTIEAFRMTHPGKKLHFMGTEFGQFLEWRYYSGLEWASLDDPMNKKHLNFIKDLNDLYKNTKALWEIDHKNDGLEIMLAAESEHPVLTFIRKGNKERDFLIVLCNFKPHQHDSFEVGAPFKGQYEELLNTEMEQYGGTWTETQGILKTYDKDTTNQPYTLNLVLPAMSVVVLKPKRIYGVNKNNRNKENT